VIKEGKYMLVFGVGKYVLKPFSLSKCSPKKLIYFKLHFSVRST